MSNNRYIFGLYGQVGTGKSTVSQYFTTKNWDYINQDALAHQVIKEYPTDLITLFGTQISSEGQIDRKKLGDLVFNNPKELIKLVTFSYPIIINKTNSLLRQSHHHTIIEGAFFYKVRTQITHTHLIYIDVPNSLLKKRLIQRGHPISWIENVLASQQDITNHAFLADFTLSNNQDLPYLYHQIEQIINSLSL